MGGGWGSCQTNLTKHYGECSGRKQFVICIKCNMTLDSELYGPMYYHLPITARPIFMQAAFVINVFPFCLSVVSFYLQRRTAANNGRQCVYLRPVNYEKNQAIADKSYIARCYASAAYAVMRVCVSVKFVGLHSVKMNKHIFKSFSPSGIQPHHSSFSVYQTAQQWPIPTGTPLTGASNAGGVGRNRYSEPISGFTAWCEGSSGKCNTFSCDEPWRVCKTNRW